MTIENEQKLMLYISELEARLTVAEKYINDVVELNNINAPTSFQVLSELSKQKKISYVKYVHLTY